MGGGLLPVIGVLGLLVLFGTYVWFRRRRSSRKRPVERLPTSHPLCEPPTDELSEEGIGYPSPMGEPANGGFEPIEAPAPEQPSSETQRYEAQTTEPASGMGDLAGEDETCSAKGSIDGSPQGTNIIVAIESNGGENRGDATGGRPEDQEEKVTEEPMTAGPIQKLPPDTEGITAVPPQPNEGEPAVTKHPQEETAKGVGEAKEAGDDVFEPGHYRPPTSAPPKQRDSRKPLKDLEIRQHPFELRVNAHLDRHGYCTFRLLAQQPAGFPAEFEVRCAGKSADFLECSEGWCEVDTTNHLSDWLAGVLFTEKGKAAHLNRWQLSSRDVHVLAAQQGFAGPTSVSRLCLGRKHLVLCRASRAEEVLRALAASGCGPISACAEEMGAPHGWVFFWPVTPTQPVPLSPEDDILNVLRPQPEIELVLEGGLCLWDSVWLVGYPPQIRVNGVLPTGEPVYVDTKLAIQDTDETYTVPGYAEPGSHLVSSVGKMCSYVIHDPECSWEGWDAHTFPAGIICGALCVPQGSLETQLVTVPVSNPVLIGSRPGQMFRCTHMPGKEWTGFVPFPAVWALPDDPLHCDKGTSYAVRVNAIKPEIIGSGRQHGYRSSELERRWSQAIRDCRKKGLKVLPDEPAAIALWRAYAYLAKDLWRRWKHGG